MMKFIYRLFIFVLVFSPMAFGTVEPWSLAVMETASLVALSMYLHGTAKSGAALYRIPGIVPLLLLLAYLCLQLVPLPAGVIRLISPQTYSLYGTSAPAVGQAGWRPLSINARATVMELFRLASYAAFYILTVQLLSRRDLLKRTVAAIAIFGAVLSLFAILQQVLSNGRIYWIRELTQGGAFFGPYVNRNHFAGLMEMIFPVVFCLFLFHKPDFSGGSFRERISGIFDGEMANVSILLGFSAVLIGTSVFLSLSRGGVVSLSLSMLVMSILLMRREKKRKQIRLFILILSLVVLCVGWFGWKPIIERFEPAGRSEISDLRVSIWKDSVGIIKDFPVVGTGFGSYVNIYPKYRSIFDDELLNHAHNDYIELLADGGVIASALFGWFLFEVLLTSYRAFARRRELYSIYVFTGSVTGLVSILFHSVVDFNLQIGANGLYFFFLLGLAVSAAHTRMREGLGETSLGKRVRPLPGLLRSISVLIMVLSVVFNTGLLLGGAAFAYIRDLALQPALARQELVKIRALSRRAALFDPLNAAYYRSVADAEWRLGDVRAALTDYEKAVRLDPASGEYVQMLGLLTGGNADRGTADALLRAGIGLDSTNPEEYKRYASWLFAAGKKEEGVPLVKKAITLDPRKTREYITLMVLYGLGDGQMRAAIPDLAEPHLLFAEYLSGTGNDGMADDEYRNALEHATKEKGTPSSFFYRISRYYDERGMHDDALMVLNRAEEALPGDAGIHLAAGDAYNRAGITYRAEEEYRKALIIDPGNGAARKRIEELRK
jgi:O-antigen ligase/tetratricopeptide (TPR) repeat protein